MYLVPQLQIEILILLMINTILNYILNILFEAFYERLNNYQITKESYCLYIRYHYQYKDFLTTFLLNGIFTNF